MSRHLTRRPKLSDGPRLAARTATALALLLTACHSDVPTSVLLTVRNAAEARTPTALRVQVFNHAGMVYDMRRAPDEGDLPDAEVDGTLGTVFVKAMAADGEMRFVVRGLATDLVISEGTGTALVRDGEQTQATVVLEGGRLPDADRDGVPDRVDNCPAVANPQQAPSCTTDGSMGGANTSLRFDGVDDQLVIPRLVSHDFTIELWMKTICDENATLLEAPTTGKKGFRLSLVGGHAVAWTGGTNITSSNVLNRDQWVHLALTRKQFDPGSIMHLYVNGVIDPSGPTNWLALDDSPTVTIGGGPANPYCGVIDEVRVWDIERAPSDILATKDVSLTGSEAHLVGYWRFDDGMGWFASDSTAARNDSLLGAGDPEQKPAWDQAGAPVN